MPTSLSEVARLRQQIELECQALHRLTHDPASVASHRTITHKYQAVGLHMDKLTTFVGEDEAREIAARIYIQVMG